MTAQQIIEIPNQWNPRGYQLPAWRAMEDGCRRAVLCWHRRSGKDAVGMNFAASAAHDRIGAYWHMLPTAAQARKVVWDKVDRETGQKSVDIVFPPEVRAGKNSTEMKIELKCGSLWQLCGSDNYDNLVGGDPLGVIFSEYSLSDPAAWDHIRPILAENGGWAMFIYTARGRNHGQSLYNMARKTDGWFAEILTIDDTRRPDGSPVIPISAIEEDRRSGMAEEMIQQEYYCSFDAALVGSYYGQQMAAARKEKRIRHIPYDETLPVETWWDLGYNDSTCIWFVQRVGLEIRLIDYYENNCKGIPFYAKILQERGYVYGRHLAPHDIKVHEFGSGITRVATARKLNLNFKAADLLPLADGIDASRALLARCYFDEDKCERGIECLTSYRKEWDDKRKVFHNTPDHDWASHGADAFRTGAVMPPPPSNVSGQVFAANTDFSVL